MHCSWLSCYIRGRFSTTGSLYGDGVGVVPTSDYFGSVGPNLAQRVASLVTTDMDDSGEWNGSEMESFDMDDSDLIDELKINDITHVTTPMDNSNPMVDKFHETNSYTSIVDTIADKADSNKFKLSHVGDKKKWRIPSTGKRQNK